MSSAFALAHSKRATNNNDWILFTLSSGWFTHLRTNVHRARIRTLGAQCSASHQYVCTATTFVTAFQDILTVRIVCRWIYGWGFRICDAFHFILLRSYLYTHTLTCYTILYLSIRSTLAWECFKQIVYTFRLPCVYAEKLHSIFRIPSSHIERDNNSFEMWSLKRKLKWRIREFDSRNLRAEERGLSSKHQQWPQCGLNWFRLPWQCLWHAFALE